MHIPPIVKKSARSAWLCRLFVFAAMPCVTFTSRPVMAAQPPDTTEIDTVDLSAGRDIFSPDRLALNPTTHKLYVSGFVSNSSTAGYALKIIDTQSRQAVGSVDFGQYADAPFEFRPLGIAVDTSSDSAGNKIYVVGDPYSANAALRIIDGDTATNLTAEGTDMFLPVGTGDPTSDLEAFSSIAVNPNNHKVYVATGGGKIVVIDGPNRTILTTLNPDAGGFLVMNPVTNKVFVMGHNTGAIIDSATDTVTSMTLFVSDVSAAAFNPTNGRIYFAGTSQTRRGIFMLDGTTGELLGKKTGYAQSPLALAVSIERGSVFAALGGGEPARIVEHNATDLAVRGEFPHVATRLAYDSAAGGRLFLIDQFDPVNLSRVAALNGATGELARITAGYRPHGVAVNSRTGRVYLPDSVNAEMLVLSSSSHGVLARAEVTHESPYTSNPRELAVSERLDRVYLPRREYVGGGSTLIVDVLDGATAAPRSSITVGSNLSPGLVAVDDTRRRIYVAAVRFGNRFLHRHLLFVYDADTEALLNTIELGEHGFAGMAALAVNPVLGRIYVVHSGRVSIVDADTNAIVAAPAVDGGGPVAVNRRTGKVFVAGSRAAGGEPTIYHARIAVIDGRTDSVESAFFPVSAAEDEPDRIVALEVDEVSNTIYAAHAQFRADRVTVFNGENYSPLGEFKLAGASDLAFDQRARKLFVPQKTDGTVTVLKNQSAAEPDLLGNISTRGRVNVGDDALIGGFIVVGPPGAAKKVMVRAIGPSLAAAGVAGALNNTTLELHDSAGNVVRNDDWKIDLRTNGSQEAAMTATGIAPTHELESAIMATLPPGPCTVVLRGKDGATGVALVEVYDIDRDATAAMANIATRGPVGTGENVMIGGLIVLGSNPSRVLVRAIGPSLPAEVASALQDPVLELRDVNGGLIDISDDWKAGRASEIAETTIPPIDDRESAIVATLHPGNYTAIVRGKNDTSGSALVEAYRLE